MSDRYLKIHVNNRFRILHVYSYGRNCFAGVLKKLDLKIILLDNKNNYILKNNNNITKIFLYSSN